MGDAPTRCLPALADDHLDLLADRRQADAQRLQRLGRYPVVFMDEAQQDVLGTDVVVIQHPGFFLRQDYNPPRPVGEPLVHAELRPSRPRPAIPGAY